MKLTISVTNEWNFIKDNQMQIKMRPVSHKSHNICAKGVVQEKLE